MSFAADDEQDPNASQSQVDKATKADQSAANAAPTAASNDQPTGGGAGGVVSAGSPSAADATKPSSSGSWTNLNSYLNANADQGAKVGGDVASSVNAQGQAAQNDVSKLNDDFNNQVQSNTVNANPDAVNGAVTAATTTGQLTPDQISAYQGQANASYGGPTDVTKNANYGQALTDVNGAQTAAQQTQSEVGRNQLLKGQYQNASQNGYNQGENNLDQMILENSSGGQQALQPLAQKWGGLTNTLNGTVTSGNTAAQQAQATTAATAGAAQSALSGATNNFQTGLNTQVTNDRASQTDLYNRMIAQEKTGVFDPDVAKLLGITNGQRLYNVDFAQANNTFDPSTITAANAATSQQYAQAQALAQLAGQQSSSLLPGAPGAALSPLVDQAKIAQGIKNASAQYQDVTTTGAQQVLANLGMYNGNAVGSDIIQAEKLADQGYFTNQLANQGGNASTQEFNKQNADWEKLYESLNPNKYAQINGQPVAPISPVKVGGPGRQVIPR